jgi:hypothetical protein
MDLYPFLRRNQPRTYPASAGIHAKLVVEPDPGFNLIKTGLGANISLTGLFGSDPLCLTLLLSLALALGCPRPRASARLRACAAWSSPPTTASEFSGQVVVAGVLAAAAAGHRR